MPPAEATAILARADEPTDRLLTDLHSATEAGSSISPAPVADNGMNFEPSKVAPKPAGRPNGPALVAAREEPRDA